VYDKCGEEGFHPATNAIDGNTSSYWAHVVSCYHKIVFDLGGTKVVTRVRLYQMFPYIYCWGQEEGLSVYVSNDPEDWGDAVWEGAMYASYWQETGPFEKVGRYVRLVSKSDYVAQTMMEFDAEVLRVGGKMPGRAGEEGWD